MAIKKRPVSPRQKMINLMYVVLMAMLALNVSTEVLQGFSLVEESLNRTTANSSQQNATMYDSFEEQMKKNPEKVRQWFEKATTVKQMSDSLYNFAQQLKEAIVREADGKDGDVKNIENKENLEAANQVMLAPGTGKGKALYDAINAYRTKILSMVTDEQQKKIISSNLSTELPKNAMTMGKNWQEYMFEDMPVAAAVTLLSKLQSDIRYAEGEVLHTLVANVDVKDIRVNKLDAFVIPEKTTLYPGEQFVNTTNGRYSFSAGGVGEHQFSGYLITRNAAGEELRRDFTQKYSVIPTPDGATVAADLMNVLYAGFKNPISVSVPGIPANQVTVSMSGGSLTPTGNGHYIAVPSAVGKDVSFNISVNDHGKTRSLTPFTFHVRKLPDPTPYMIVGDNRFRGGRLAKASLMGASGIKAAIDDGLLDIEFRVTGFEAVFFDNMGNAVPMVGNGSQFSERQKDAFRKLSRNRRFYISRVTAVGPDGISRQLNASMEIIVN